MKHLPDRPSSTRMRARFPPASSRRWCCRACAASRRTAATSPTSDIDALVDYLGVPRIQIEEVLSFYTQFRREADRPLARRRRAATCRARCAAPSGIVDHLDAASSASRPARRRADGRFTLSTVECLGLVRHRAGGDGQRDVPRERDAREARRAARDADLA